MGIGATPLSDAEVQQLYHFPGIIITFHALKLPCSFAWLFIMKYEMVVSQF
jgi:hypothetical protein